MQLFHSQVHGRAQYIRNNGEDGKKGSICIHRFLMGSCLKEGCIHFFLCPEAYGYIVHRVAERLIVPVYAPYAQTVKKNNKLRGTNYTFKGTYPRIV